MNNLYIRIVLSASVSVFAAAINFILNVYIARIFKEEVFASYSFYISLATIISVIVSLGINQYLLLNIPKINKEAISEISKKAYTSITLFFLPVIFITILYLYFRGESIVAMLSFVFISYIASILLLKQSIYTALKKIIVYQMCDKVFRNSFILIVLFIFSNELTFFYELIMVVAGGYFLSFLVMQFNLNKGERYNLSSDFFKFIDIKSLTPLYFVFLTTTLMSNVDILILDSITTESNVAVFSASQKIALLSGFFLNAIANILVPYFVKERENKQEIGIKAKMSSQFGFASISVFFVAMCFLGEWVLSVFGEGYKAGYFIMLCLIMNIMLSALYGQTLTLMKVKNEGKYLAKLMIFSLAVKFIIVYPLFLYFGVFGVVISSSICTLIWNHLSYLKLKNKYSINTLVFQR